MGLLLLLRRLATIWRLVKLFHFAVGVGVLLLFQALGSWIATEAHIPIPGSVIGMVLIAGGIQLRVVPLFLIRPAADHLVRHLAVLYVPAGVAVMLYTGLLRAEWIPITVAALVSLVAVLVTVGLTVQRLETHPAEPDNMNAGPGE